MAILGRSYPVPAKTAIPAIVAATIPPEPPAVGPQVGSIMTMGVGR